MRMTESEYMDMLEKRGIKTTKSKPKRKPKYNNKKTWVDGLCFDSLKESKYYQDLKVLQMAGEIAGFSLQPEFVLVEGNAEERAITYRADFIIFNLDGSFEVVDVKGYESPQWKRTYKQFRLKYPELKLKIVKEV